MASNGASSSPTIDKTAFWSRLKRLYDSKKTSKTWGGDTPVDAIVVLRGEANDEDPPYTKTTALQFWLFGYELLDTILIVGEKSTLIVTSEKKAKLLAVLGDKGPTGIGLTIRTKDKSDYKADFAHMLKFIGAGKGTRVGAVPKDPLSGAFATGFNSALTASGAEIVDVSLGFSTVMAVKDDTEIKYTTEAAAFTTLVLKKFLVPQVETVIDEEKKVKHSELAARVDTVFEDPSKVKSKVAKDMVDICYPAIVMSGKYDLRPSAESDDENLQSDGTVILQLGGKYANYPANVARTYFVNPSKEQQDAYSVLIEIFAACKASMKAGRKMSAVWEAAQDTIKRRNPALLPHFTKNCGFGLGLDFRDSHMVLNAANSRTFAANMVFNLAIGFSDLKCKDKKGQERTFAVLLADTLHITQDSEPEILTHLPRSYKDIVYTIDEDDGKADPAVKKEPVDGVKQEKKSDDEDDDESEDDAPLISGPRTRYQREATAAAENALTEVQTRIRENQKLLADRVMAEGYRRYAEDSADRDDDKEEKKETAEVSCYKGPSEFPTAARPNQIFVDQNNECILVPLFEQHVPFHISTIKNLHKTEGETTFLRINFFTPDMAFNANQKLPAGAGANHMFIQELTFRSKGKNLDQVYFSINELRKRYSARMKEHEQKSSLVEQEDLVLARADKVYRLRDIAVRPQMARGKATGMVEVHQNGLRFVGGKSGVRLDLIFKNIKHAFFQAATKTTINVLCHFELHNPIMVGKKKSQFVQFFYDVIEASQDLETRARHADEDGLLEEQEERKMRDKWNTKFLDFVREVENAARGLKLEFDKPYPELSFFGVASKELVPMMPTVHCLVALDDNPPVCVTLADVEIAVFERLAFGLKSFDLTFVFKDLDKPVQTIVSIPVKHLDTVKEWLNQCNILFYEIKINMAWKNIIKEIRKDLAGFYQDGGWEILRGELGNDDGEGGGGGGDGDDEEAESESGSEFAPSGDDEEDEESSEYDTSSEEVSEGDESDVGSDSEEENSEEDDWEELEKQAEKEDREKVRKERERDVVEKARPPAKRQKNK